MLIVDTGVFTLLTISIGEELELKFFKVLSCVSCILLSKTDFGNTYNPFEGLDRDMHRDVASRCCKNSEAYRQRQNVFCAMFRNRPVLKKVTRKQINARESIITSQDVQSWFS